MTTGSMCFAYFTIAMYGKNFFTFHVEREINENYDFIVIAINMYLCMLNSLLSLVIMLSFFNALTEHTIENST